MPLTPFQADIFRVIAAQRNPDSYVAGGIVINRGELSPRFSDDIDLFHDTAQAVAASSEKDAGALKKAGYDIVFLRQEPSFHQAKVERAGENVRLDWAHDSAFRFFPIVPDPVLGFRLHDADAATNKVLAAIARRKVRDFIDLMEVDRTYTPLGVAVWAAVAKDEGWTPELMMQELRRNSRINPETLDGVMLVEPQNPVKLKAEWLDCFARAEALMATFPPESFGSFFLNAEGGPVRGEKFDPSWTPHFGSVKGAWPTLS
jgi:hypothetical protein